MGSLQSHLITTFGGYMLTLGTKQEDCHHLGRADLYGMVTDGHLYLSLWCKAPNPIQIITKILARDGFFEDIDGDTVEAVLANSPLII